ncbi:Rdx family [Teratosphaeria destructans]|uniref:Rdx family n=1 Tax=Teratosphaeria destructans TaxID=418781 RepID=A0A9W7SKM5_9PEZI|nr:Rdx family [Teratosphaeria destructans]
MKGPTLRIEECFYASDTSILTPQRWSGSIKHFNRPQRTLSRWDGLRRDPMLWCEEGDCLVHLYSLGGSQRGPSLRLRYADVEALKSRYLSECCLFGRDDASRRASRPYELYIPAPASLTRAEAYEYHLTTRNFFAYATGKPLVGETLGVALARLLERIGEWQPDMDTAACFAQYYQRLGYADLAENADYALASLILSERARLRSLWTEAFVHCVGMHDRLFLSREYQVVSDTIKASVTRASLDMDLRIARAIRALGTFLENELGPENLGLSKPARDHLDRFRSCLHNYYVDKLGYFPPRDDGPWNKRVWTKMYHAFRSLYRYLVDSESSTDPANSRNVNGGICIAQNVRAFDEKHGYPPLPHPVPLLPALPARTRSASVKRGLKELKPGKPSPMADLATRQALAHATNPDDPDTQASELVQEYQRFERLKLQEKLSISEARKVRWLLIYAVLQTLISITRAPPEVRDTETPSYPLCVTTAGCPTWLEKQARVNGASTTHLVATPAPPPSSDQGRSSRISIHPDCEADCAEDYFNSQSPNSRRDPPLDVPP